LGGWWGVVVAAALAASALAAVVLSGVARGTDELLTRGQLDKAVPGCKWWDARALVHARPCARASPAVSGVSPRAVSTSVGVNDSAWANAHASLCVRAVLLAAQVVLHRAGELRAGGRGVS